MLNLCVKHLWSSISCWSALEKPSSVNTQICYKCVLKLFLCLVHYPRCCFLGSCCLGHRIKKCPIAKSQLLYLLVTCMHPQPYRSIVHWKAHTTCSTSTHELIGFGFIIEFTFSSISTTITQLQHYRSGTNAFKFVKLWLLVVKKSGSHSFQTNPYY